MLRAFLSAQRDEIVARTWATFATASGPAPHTAFASGILLFLDEVAEALRFSPPSRAALEGIGRHAALRGAQMQRDGRTLAEVVYEYASVGRAIVELAAEANVSVTPEDLHVLRCCLDEATARAVTEHASAHEDSLADDERERMGELAHELRGSIGSARISFDLLRGGTVGFSGSTAGVLGRSLGRLSSLVEASVARVRLGVGILAPERVSVSQFIQEVEVAAAIEATAREVTLGVLPVEPGIDVEVDRSLLVGAVANLLTNAFKFSRPKGHVVLQASSASGRVLIEVQDECGGLPAGDAERLFRPFQQGSANRTGLGLGLSLSRKGVEANGGKMSARDVPGSGCVFRIDLPRIQSVAGPVA